MVSVRVLLNKGKYAKVSIEDAEEILKYKWHTVKSGNTYYARRTVRDKDTGKYRALMMHQVIAGKSPDHINRDGLDNRRSNLRKATHGQNRMNSHLQKTNKSGYTGVYYRAKSQKWTVTLGYRYVGIYKTIEEAIKARKAMENEYYGEFAPRK